MSTCYLGISCIYSKSGNIGGDLNLIWRSGSCGQFKTAILIFVKIAYNDINLMTKHNKPPNLNSGINAFGQIVGKSANLMTDNISEYTVCTVCTYIQ